jgi:hypothetical protein
MKKIKALLPFCFWLISLAFASASEKAIEFKSDNRYRATTGEEKDNLFRSKNSLNFNLPIDQAAPILNCIYGISIFPFYEGQYNLHESQWVRHDAGLGLKAELPWGFSLIEEVYYTHRSKDYESARTHHNYHENAEWMSSFELHPPFLKNLKLFKLPLDFFIFEEYYVELKQPKGVQNEVGMCLDVTINEFIKIPISYRHIDRIHTYDNDCWETGIKVIF